jgi:rhodanese-related sulfurtransferase/SAM-dependent methyltransferase
VVSGQRRSIDELLVEARRRFDRVTAADLAAEAAAGALVVDTRSGEQRARDGDLPGAVVVGRNELEWRLDPTSAHRIADATDHDRRIIVVCNEGYASSLAAESLHRLGLHRATDLDGGFQAWRAVADTARAEAASRHWDDVFRTRDSSEVSWFQAEPTTSLELISAAGIEPTAAVVDVGGGASVLVDRLVARGHRAVTVLDVSGEALERARVRLGDDAAKVRWITHDVLTWRPPRRYGLWHDRALFHFLVGAPERAAYRAVLHAALGPGGHVVVGTFAADGPEMCSGLPTARYSPAELAAAFGPELDVVVERREEHHTPTGTVQPITWLLLRKRT